ncbi:environmental stress-induced protein Ves [Arthrobacter woluwensis]|uniref:HutD/Ves family protein n=1 Tax=Arthrobacter woluwensis TaxID=156980 RepID=UPI0027872487|nr:HutD family protein [Arthrobacter woluwensis]MDQ0710081.1 environmental stress-induced protein Ves [Arthrobacter woluwensis]
MEIIRFSSIRPEPWRNGGGVTREIARHPRGASDGSWDWRVSIAEVGKAGDFSTFPGMERVISVIDGELLVLTVDGEENAMERYRPFRFSGDAVSSSALPTGDIRDLNVIARRGAFKGYLSILELSKKRAHPIFEGQLAILLEGKASVAEERGEESGDGQVELGRYDAVVGSDEASPELLGRGFVAIVSLDPADPADA